MFNFRPPDPWPWFNVRPPDDELPGFRLAPDGSTRNDAAFIDPTFAASASPIAIGFAAENRLPSGNSFDFVDRHDSTIYSPVPLGTSPAYPSMAGMPYLDPGLKRYLDDLSGKLDTSPAAGDPRFLFGANGSTWLTFPNNPGSFGYGRPDDSQALTDPPIRVAKAENRDSFAPYDPTNLVLPPPNPLQDAFDQLSQIYARVGLDPLNRFNGAGAITSPTGLRGVELSPTFGDAFDPQYVVPLQAKLPSDVDEGTNAGAAESPQGLSIDPLQDNPLGRRDAADGLTGNIYLNDTTGDPAIATQRLAGDAFYPAAYSDFEPASVLTRIDSRLDNKSFNDIGTQGLGADPTTVGGVTGDPTPVAEINGTFDPRYIVRTGSPPPSRPPGPGHNGGPPLWPNSSAQIPTQPSRSGPIQGVPAAPQTPDNSSAVGGAAAAAGATDPKQSHEPPPAIEPEVDDKLEAWRAIVAARGTQVPGSQYLGPDGINTLIGVRLHPRLPEPAAGRGYLPAWRHLRHGYRGELELANRIVSALPNEIIIHYGMPAGRSGPDVISVSPSGMVSIWDSKWRSGQRSIGPGERAHQSDESFESLQWELRRRIRDAVESGRLSSEIAAMATKNVNAGNFDIYTIGTGNAHGGVAEAVRGGVRSGVRRQ